MLEGLYVYMSMKARRSISVHVYVYMSTKTLRSLCVYVGNALGNDVRPYIYIRRFLRRLSGLYPYMLEML